MADDQRAGPESKELVGWVVAGLIVLGLVAFVFQNTRRVRVEWLFWERRMWLWLVVLVSAVAGAVLARVIGWLRRRRRD
jgi:uncharacterized integral membrane protein